MNREHPDIWFQAQISYSPNVLDLLVHYLRRPGQFPWAFVLWSVGRLLRQALVVPEATVDEPFQRWTLSLGTRC